MKHGLRISITLLLSLIAVAAFVQLVFINTPTGLPFNVAARGTSMVITPLPGVPLSPGLQAGDELEPQQMTLMARTAFLPNTNIRAGLPYDLVVRRGQQILHVTVISQKLPVSANHLLNTSISDVLIFAVLVLGLLAIWRGRNLAARGLGLFAVALIVQVSLRALPLPARWIMAVSIIADVVVFPLMFLGLYLMAYALSAEGIGRRVQRSFSGVFALLYLLFMALNVVGIVGFVFYALRGSSLASASGFVLLTGMGLITFSILVVGYARASAELRLRIRWILYSTGLMVLAVIVSMLGYLNSNAEYQLILANIGNLLLLLTVVGYTYAVLRQRLVDLRIVLNRTLVYGVITAIVVGVFAAINALVERATLGHGASLILELIVPLALGIVLGTMRKYIDTYINRFLFRRQYQAEKALNDFARTCGFIEQPERLLDLTVQQVFAHSHAQSVALYEREVGGYTRVRQQGTAEFPERVEADDLAFVRLRGGDSEADLHELTSTLGTEGHVFSMAIRGKLIGALVCGPRPAEQYTADERALLSHVARQAGAALHALRSREHEQFVRSIADGALDSSSAREHARQLLANWQTA